MIYKKLRLHNMLSQSQSSHIMLWHSVKIQPVINSLSGAQDGSSQLTDEMQVLQTESPRLPRALENQIMLNVTSWGAPRSKAAPLAMDRQVHPLHMSVPAPHPPISAQALFATTDTRQQKLLVCFQGFLSRMVSQELYRIQPLKQLQDEKVG